MFSPGDVYQTLIGPDGSVLNSLVYPHEHNPFILPFVLLENWDAASPHLKTPLVSRSQVDHIYYALLQRPVESEDVYECHLSAHVSIGGLIESLMCSIEFHERCLILLENAFPNARFIIHPHIPKTAGTTFAHCAFEAGFASINWNATHNEKTIDYLKMNLPISKILRKGIYVGGHRYIYETCSMLQRRHETVIFVRDPVDRALSMINYVAGLLSGDTGIHRASPDVFLEAGFDLHSLDRSLINGTLPANDQCRYLTQSALCSDAIIAADTYSCRIVPYENISREAKIVFGHVTSEYLNLSTSRINRTHLSSGTISSLMLNNSEDVLLYQVAKQIYPDSGGLDF